ncbi:MAG: L-threonylcarbamoyladenylate synthase [Oscillospiraceae bacterium]|nr:L-threonylcarbamoyladenylate synthase [Oscillospiraceae bacterium]
MQTVVIKDGDLSYAAAVLKNGGLAGVPTETVYGLAANGYDAAAVDKIYKLKGRPEVKPLSLLVSDVDAAAEVCAIFPKAAMELAKAFWPGPLTIVLPCNKKVPPVVTATGYTVGVRCPDHPKTLELLRLAGVPIAAPSANISGCPSPKTAQEVLKYFDGKIECIIDGGTCTLGVESTIVSLTADSYKILRQGALSEALIARVLEKM